MVDNENSNDNSNIPANNTPFIPFEFRQIDTKYSPMYPEILTNTLMVQFKPGESLTDLNRKTAMGVAGKSFRFKQIRHIPQINWTRIALINDNNEVIEPKIVPEKSLEALPTLQLIFNLKHLGYVANSDPVRPRYFQYENIPGPDPLLAGLFKDPTGRPIVSYQFEKCNVYEAWKLVMGNPSMACVVVDSGIEYGNPEFENRIDPNGKDFISPNLPQAKGDGSATLGDGIDNDNNGDADDQIFHGTLVASCITGLKDNSLYAAGISPNSMLISYRVLSGDGDSSSTTDELSAAITSAADLDHVKAINLSLGSAGDVQSERDACNYAISKNKTLIASAGNIDRSVLAPGEFPPVYYPAGYPSVVAVGATDKNDKITTFSNFGSFVDLVAPGSQIFGPMYPYLNNQFNPYYIGIGNGTSFSCPIVAGVVMLMYDINPKLTPAEVQDALVKSTDDISSINPTEIGYGSGRLNAYKAVLAANPKPSSNDVTRTGDEFDDTLYSNNILVDKENKRVLLNPDLSSGNNPVAYVAYKFVEIPTTVQTGYVNIKVEGITAQPRYWLGIPNYKKNIWVWYGPFNSNDYKFSLTADMYWLNKKGEFRFVILAYDGIGINVNSVFFHYNP